jgi:Leucine-rich repeat (LRR) protein
LQSLTNLTWLDLRNNPLSSKTCPVKPASVCRL